MLLSCGSAVGSSDTWKGRKRASSSQLEVLILTPECSNLSYTSAILNADKYLKRKHVYCIFLRLFLAFWPYSNLHHAFSLFIFPWVSVGFNISSYLFPNNTQLQHVEKALRYLKEKGSDIIRIIRVTVVSPGHKSIHILQDINHALNGWDLKKKLPSWTCCCIIAYYGSFMSSSEASGTGTISLIWNDNSRVPLWSIPMTL